MTSVWKSWSSCCSLSSRADAEASTKSRKSRRSWMSVRWWRHAASSGPSPGLGDGGHWSWKRCSSTRKISSMSWRASRSSITSEMHISRLRALPGGGKVRRILLVSFSACTTDAPQRTLAAHRSRKAWRCGKHGCHVMRSATKVKASCRSSKLIGALSCARSQSRSRPYQHRGASAPPTWGRCGGGGGGCCCCCVVAETALKAKPRSRLTRCLSNSSAGMSRMRASSKASWGTLSCGVSSTTTW
mmetsp:Transcript_18098/g.56729  ORF Transcript_18098/g.56729 Transcript_18098/m.56729 type:complete len:244 (-) Transcript_18098:1344-2075(-)